MRIIFVVKEEETANRYLQEIVCIPDLICECVPSFSQLHKQLIEKEYNGILIDIPTKILTSAEDNAMVHTVLQMYPVMRLKWDKTEDSVKALSHHETQTIYDINYFIRKQCAEFLPRKLRSSDRLPIQFNILMSTEALTTSDMCEKTVTENISLEGCFIVTSNTRDSNIPLWIRFKEVDETEPIQAHIIWQIPWGREMRFPGIGVRFVNLSQRQKDNLYSWF